MVKENETYDIYTVIKETSEKDKYRHRLYEVKCNICGKTFIKVPNEFAAPSAICNKCTHNQAEWGREFKGLAASYRSMLERCYHPNRREARYYRDKGIRVCDEWLNNPEVFKEWAIKSGWEPGLTIDRIDSNDNYCPENCRWISKTDNAKYKSSTRCLTVNGITHTGRDWARELGLGENRINIYVRKFGEDMTKEFIKSRLEGHMVDITFFH